MSLAIVGARLDGTTVSLRAVGGVIAEIGPAVVAQPGDERIEASGLALVPGLVNGHTHAAMSLLRGYADDLPLDRWLRERIWPAEALLDSEDVYWGTRLAALEMIRSGTVRFFDMYFHPEHVARAVRDAGLRATVGVPVIEAEGAPTMHRLDELADTLDALAEFGARITPAIAAHAIYTVTVDTLRAIAELGEQRRVPLQIHVAETRAEVEECVADHGVRPAHYLDDIGALGERTVLAHGVWLDDEELSVVADQGATIVTNPASNMLLGVGRAFPYPAARAAGAPVGLGTDGPASNNSLDLFQEVKLFALLQKHTTGDPTILDAHEAWRVATGRGSALLGGTSVAVGGAADFLLVDTARAELAPAELESALVYSATGAVVDTTVVDGRVLMEHRVVTDAEEIVARAAERAARIRI